MRILSNSHGLKISIISLWTSILGAIILIFLLFFPYKVVTINSPQKVLTPIVKAGEAVTISSDYCKYIAIGGTASKDLVGGDISLPLTPVFSNTPTGCHIVIRAYIVPSFTPPGKYKITTTTVYHVNFLRDVSVKYETEEFTVIK